MLNAFPPDTRIVVDVQSTVTRRSSGKSPGFSDMAKCSYSKIIKNVCLQVWNHPHIPHLCH